MFSLIVMIVKASIAIVLGVFSSDSKAVKFTNENKNCGEPVLLSCEVINTKNQHQWYRSSFEKIQKILNESSIDQLSPYKVESTYKNTNSKTGDVTLDYLSRFDTGWYSCLDLSTEGYPKVTRSIWLEVRCEGNKNKYHTKQQMEKIQNGIAPPYLIMKRIFNVEEGRDTLSLEICARGYPKPKYNITYVTNHRETYLQDFDSYGMISLRIPIIELNVPTTLSFFVCNTNGCINDTIHSIHVTGNRIVLEETPNQAILYLCCYDELNPNWNVTWFVNTTRRTTITEVFRIQSGVVVSYPIPEITYLDEGFYECRKLQNSKWMSIGVFHLKIWNDSTPAILSAEHGSSFTNQTTTNDPMIRDDDINFESGYPGGGISIRNQRSSTTIATPTTTKTTRTNSKTTPSTTTINNPSISITSSTTRSTPTNSSSTSFFQYY